MREFRSRSKRDLVSGHRPYCRCDPEVVVVDLKTGAQDLGGLVIAPMAALA
jgi:hypothetical protein